MERQQLIRKIHWMGWQLRTFEYRHGVLSLDFYQRWDPVNCPSLTIAQSHAFTISLNGTACTTYG